MGVAAWEFLARRTEARRTEEWGEGSRGRASQVIVGVGVDVVDIARVQRLLDRHAGRIVKRLFTNSEAAYSGDRLCPAPHYAARIAAKEAAFKALAGHPLARSIGWREIEVVSDGDGIPTLTFHGMAARRAEQLRVRQCWVSLSHSDTAAAAVVILETL
jgi:holo-[acyl-carrier protein] synthase